MEFSEGDHVMVTLPDDGNNVVRLVVNQRDRQILAGNHTWHAARSD